MRSSASLMRTPDLTLTRQDGGVYLRRWHLIPRNKFFNVYLHQFLGSDDDRALHDHPWPFLSWIIKGEYDELTPGWYFDQDRLSLKRTMRKRWSVAYRPAKWAHRVQLLQVMADDCPTRWVDQPAWTIILTGPKIRPWGFHCPQGWVHWWHFDLLGGCGED